MRKETPEFIPVRNFAQIRINSTICFRASFGVIHSVLSYNTRLQPESQADFEALLQMLKWQQLAFNEASKAQFILNKNSIVLLHAKFYRRFRKEHPEIPAQVVIRAEQEVLSAYRSAKSNKHRLKEPVVKSKLSMRFDKRLFSQKNPYVYRFTTANGRKNFKFVVYGKLSQLIGKYPCADPLIYFRNGQIWLSLTFKIDKPEVKPKLALGVDLGCRIAAACSDGRLIADKKFNARKRKLRYLKRQLQSKGTKSARRHLRKVRHKEQNANRNQSHLLANTILQTNANVIVLENLKGIKGRKNYESKNRISQVPLYALCNILTYKAELLGKRVVLVNPAYTSQTDSATGKVSGKRCGRRFYAESGVVYDADLNAARNIGQRSKLPVSYGDILDGQAHVSAPIVCKPHRDASASLDA